MTISVLSVLAALSLHAGAGAVVKAFSGERHMAKGDELHFDFELLLTPFKLVNRDVKYGDRYFHGGTQDEFGKLARARELNANIVNIHHASAHYPFINYPYLDENIDTLKLLIDDAHEHGQRLKVYYTTRELTKNIPEFWAFNSLQGEVLLPGPGNECRTFIHEDGPSEWLKTNMKENYIPAWYSDIDMGRFKGEIDLSVLTTPDSRLNNFYIGGLDWMLRNMEIDGVYVDDSALDRMTVRRARRLIEVASIPFGLPGQMLQNGGNRWRGMIYGMTNRAGWAAPSLQGLRIPQGRGFLFVIE